MKLIVILNIFLIASCCSAKDFFRERLDDGTTIHASTWTCKKKKLQEPDYFIAGRHSQELRIHDEYFIPVKKCDSLEKRVFKGKGVKIFLLTNEPNPQYLISKPDSIIFSRMQSVLKTNDSCFSKFILSATGYKLIDETENRFRKNKKK